MVPDEEGATARRLATREDRRGKLTGRRSGGTGSRASPWRLAALWLCCAAILPLALFGLWAAPVMRVMDSLRRSAPLPDWVLALHGQSLGWLMVGVATVLTIGALLGMRGQLLAARAVLLNGSGGLVAISLAVLTLVWL